MPFGDGLRRRLRLGVFNPLASLPTPHWMNPSAYVASIDPNFPRKSIMFRQFGTHEYGKGNILTGKKLWTYAAADISNISNCAPCIADIDGDGVVEIIFASITGIVYCLKGDGTFKWKYDAGGVISTSVGVFDVDQDGKAEIFVGSFLLHCLNSDGTLRWTYLTDGIVSYASNFAFYDLDDDGEIEIITGSEDGYLYVLKPDGTLSWKLDVGNVVRGLAVADIDNDGVVEIVVAAWTSIRCIKADGTLKWTSAATSSTRGLYLSDVDNDGELEIVVGNGWDISCYEVDGAQKWTYTTGGAVRVYWGGSFDIDKDGTVECLAGSVDTYLYCLKGDGKLKWRYKTGSFVFNSGSIADVDGDGYYEVVFGSNDHYLYCLKYDGTLKWRFDGGNVFQYTVPSIDDINNDGKLEIVVGAVSLIVIGSD